MSSKLQVEIDLKSPISAIADPKLTPIDVAISDALAKDITEALNVASEVTGSSVEGELDESFDFAIPVKLNLFSFHLNSNVEMTGTAKIRVVTEATPSGMAAAQTPAALATAEEAPNTESVIDGPHGLAGSDTSTDPVAAALSTITDVGSGTASASDSSEPVSTGASSDSAQNPTPTI